MRAFLVLTLVSVLGAMLAGCTDRGPIEREDLAFPVASRIAGVEPTAAGDVSFTGTDGLLVTPSLEPGTVRVGLAEIVQTNVFQACRDVCRNLTVAPGTIVADGGLVSLRNLSLNAAGPDGDAAVFFHDEGRETGRFLRWYDDGAKFQMNGDLQTIGNVTGTGHVGTITPLILGEDNLVTVSTAALEGTEVAIYARGSARLINGTATVAFPAAFVALVGEGPMTVQVTLTSPAPALWVAEKAADHVTVESVAGTSATFDWFVQAARKGGERFEV